jgi:hypothetical protein
METGRPRGRPVCIVKGLLMESKKMYKFPGGLSPTCGMTDFTDRWNPFRQLEDLLRAISPAMPLDGISEKLDKAPDTRERNT